MIAKILSAAVLAGFVVSAVPAYAADAPKTKAACEKAKMTWDAKAKKCTEKK
jgi:hypothetical protein